MWILRGSEGGADNVHFLVCGQQLIVGRRDSHVLLSNDKSVSRKHASLTLTFSSVNLKTKEVAKVLLQDLGSTYGTYINENIEKNQQIPPNANQELRHGDRIRFGTLANIWRLEHQQLTVTTSTLKSEGRQQLINALITLGGHVHNDWSSECCYLVMPSISLTMKVGYALASGCRIVLPEFFTKLAEAIIKKTPHPNPAMFLPQIMMKVISSVSYSPDLRRSSIFAGLTFLFSTQALLDKKYTLIQLAGGKAKVLSEDNHENVVSGKFLLINFPEENQQASTLYNKTFELLRRHRLRTIQDTEIVFAILCVSTERHCNSSFKDSDIFKRSSSDSQSSENQKILATESQSREFSVNLSATRIVAESGRQPTTSVNSDVITSKVHSKRQLSISESDESNAKRSNRGSSPDLTQPLSTLDLCDESEDIKMDENEVTFKPKETSTQKTDQASISINNSPTSISFVPYTLPTLKTLDPEEEEQSETLHSDKPDVELHHCEEKDMKNEIEDPATKVSQVKNVKFDEWWKCDKEKGGFSKKRGRNEDILLRDQNSKKTRIETSGKENTFSNNNHDNDDTRNKTKEKATNDADLFALPPRTQQRQRKVEISTCKQSDSDLFTLPHRGTRTRMLPSQQESVLVAPTLSNLIQDTPVVSPTPESKNFPTFDSKANVTSVKDYDTSNKFIDREKSHIKTDDSVETTEMMTSLTLVLVESMVVPQQTRLKSPDKLHDLNALPNFKQFKKVNASCILKVIGGSDLMENEETTASQGFNVDLEVKKKKQEKVPSFDEELFNLGGFTRKRRQMF